MANNLKIEKRDNGNVWITKNDVLVASMSGNATLIPHSQNDNIIVVGGSLRQKLYQYDQLIAVDNVASTIINGVETNFSGTRDDLLRVLGSGFFLMPQVN